MENEHKEFMIRQNEIFESLAKLKCQPKIDIIEKYGQVVRDILTVHKMKVSSDLVTFHILRNPDIYGK